MLGLAPSLAQEIEPAEERAGAVSAYGLADALLANGEAEAACALMLHAYGAETEDAGALMRLANCTLALGRPQESLAYLQRASANDPGNAGLSEQVAILEAAAILAELAVAVQAQEQLQATLDDAPRPAALAAPALPSAGVVDVAAVTEPDEPALPGPQVSGRVSLQRLFNSNVNGGTYNDSFTGLGLPLVVAPGSKEQSDWLTRIGADGSVTVPLDWTNAVQVNAGFSGTLHDVRKTQSRLDLFLSGAWITGTNQTGLRVGPHADLSWVDGLYDRLAIGAEASAHHKIGPDTTLVGAFDATHRWHANASETGWALEGSAGIRHVLSPQVTVGANLVAGRVTANSALRAYWRLGPEVYVNAALTDRLGLNLNAGVDFAVFDGSLALFTGQREDVRYRAGASLNWALPEIADGLALQASYSFTHQQSNQDLYDTNRHLAAVSLSYAF